MPNWHTKEATLPNAHAHISRRPSIGTSPYRVHRHPQSVSTPGSSGASTSTSPETNSASIPPPRKKRLQRSAPYARPGTSSQPINQGSSMEDTDAVALENARKGVRQFVKAQPHVLEPCIGDPAAKAIIGSTPRLGTPGKSPYSVFFGPVVVARFTCYKCAHIDTKFNRAARQQHQDHSGHYPFPYQGGGEHPAWWAMPYFACHNSRH